MSNSNKYHSDGRRKSSAKGYIFFIGSLLLLAAVAAGVYLLWENRSVPVSEPELPPAVSSSVPESRPEPELEPKLDDFSYKVGALDTNGTWDGRSDYVDGSMILEIEKLALRSRVSDGTEAAELARGPGLFLQAQLPGPYNANTSIAAHRDLDGMEFYNIHKLTDGDFMHLYYEGYRYTYEYQETFVTHNKDWDPIRVRDYACITLQSCDPIGTADYRIFVIGKLISITESGAPEI